MRYLPLLLLLLAFGCSPNFHCRKCFGNAEVKRDTIKIDTTIYIPVATMDTVFTPGQPSLDTLILEGPERIKIKFRDLPGPTVYIGVECPPDSVVVEKKVYIENTAKVGYSLWSLIAVALGAFGVCALLFLLRR